MSSSVKRDKEPKGLGRGLAALLGPQREAPVQPLPGAEQKSELIDGENVLYVALRDIVPSRYQPRTLWSEEKLKELAESIRQSGLLQPLVIRERGGNDRTPQSPEPYELIAGERRLRALRLAGYDRAPVVLRQVDDRTSLELAIVENIQREDLNPVDEALAYRRLTQEFQYSQEELSKKVGRDRTTITNSLRLLNLPDEIQRALSKGEISAGHARALLSLERDSDRISLKNLVVRKNLSVRETENLVREARERRQPKKLAQTVNPQIRFLEESLMASLGTKVKIKHLGRKGRVEIEYYGLEDLDRLVELMKKGK